MQDKDFDRFIQQSLENMPEPDYNPADWDRLEDQLHNFQGTQPNGTAAAAKTVSGSLGKLGFVASAILVTAVNVVLFTKPEMLKNSMGNAEKSEVSAPAQHTPASASNATSAAEITASAAQVNEVNSPETDNTTVALANNEAAGTPVQASGLPVAKVEANVAVIAAAKPVLSHKAAKNNKKVSGDKNRQPVAAWSWPAVAAGRPASGAAANGLSAGKPAGSPAILPCTIKEPALAVVVSSDTVKSNRFTLTSCQLFEASFLTSQKAAATAIITSNVATVLPGARLLFDKEKAAAVLQWNPQPEMARMQPYTFTVWVADERCPQAEPKAYQFAASVAPGFTVSVEGNTRLNKGQETELEVSGAPAGSTFRWTSGKALLADQASARLAVAPVKTTTYKVQVSAPSGCVYSDSVKVEVSTAPEIVTNAAIIPNIITPDNDGKNDYFKVQLSEPGPYMLEIFDRTGKQIFATDNYDNKWNGANVAAGTYYYLLKDANGKTYKGYFEIVR